MVFQSLVENTVSIDNINDIDKLKRINKALMTRVEKSMDQHGNAFSMFQTAINLEGQVKRRTDELTIALRGLERINSELEVAKEASEIANRSKTRFLAAASHDVLQPLNAAILSLSVLSDLQETKLGTGLALQVERSLETMNELLKTLLDISKLDAGVVKPRLEAIPLSSLFHDLLSDFQPVANEKGLDLRFKYSETNILSDRTMLRRILQNLISNGIRYTKNGGVLVGVRQRKNFVFIDVVDTGNGIPKSQQTEIFEEFHRGELPSGHDRDAESGLGLGLSIVRRMVDSLAHDLELNSTSKKGTRFRLKIPTAKVPINIKEEQLQPALTGYSNLKDVKILLVENDLAGIQASVSLFESWGCQLKIATNVDDTISTLRESKWVPDILIADFHLDHGDLGSDAVSHARKLTNENIPAIIITADPTKALEQKIKNLKMELMYKPLKPAHLRALISYLFDKNKHK